MAYPAGSATGTASMCGWTLRPRTACSRGCLRSCNWEQILRIKIEAFALDSTEVKVHRDGNGALKKRAVGDRQVQGWMEHQDSYGCGFS